jgi:hypothetical protein
MEDPMDLYMWLRLTQIQASVNRDSLRARELARELESLTRQDERPPRWTKSDVTFLKSCNISPEVV